MTFMHLHVHSNYSQLDAMNGVDELVGKSADLGFPAMGLTDHGLMTGSAQLYQQCKKHGMLPFPGIEAYVVQDVNDKSSSRFHLTMLALNTRGYQTLVKLSSKSWQRDHLHYKPRIDFADLAELLDAGLTKDLAVFTGCYFGLVQQSMLYGYREAKLHAQFLMRLFPNLFVELQHHRTKHGAGPDGKEWTDTMMVDALMLLAMDLGLPVIITQDCHYCDRSSSSTHDFMKQIAYGGDAGDYSFPGDSYHLATEKWMRAHFLANPGAWEASQESFKWLLDNNQVSIPALDKYQFHIPSVGKSDPQRRVETLCREALAAMKIPGSKLRKYKAQLDYELDIVNQLGFASYFLLINEQAEFCEREGIHTNARGSANGSLICYLMGITSIDPIQWDLTFDRFLTLDRERPPDIDIDVEDVRRGDLVEFYSSRFDVTHIGTANHMGWDEDTGKGSLFVQYLASQRRALDPDEYRRRFGGVNSVHDLPVHIRRKLRELSEFTIRKSYGVHAAGIALSTKTHKISDWIPSMLIPSSDTVVTQMQMDDVEEFGFTKMDLLGLRSLTTRRIALDYVGITKHDIPLNDSKVFRFLRKGRTETGIFQLEGWTAARGCREMQVKSIHDIILVNALYRPATLNAGHVDTFLRRKRGEESVSYDVAPDLLGPILDVTYGVPVYQEQVIEILRAVGFSSAQFNKMLKAIKASNEKIAAAEATFAGLRKAFVDYCRTNHGLRRNEADELWYMLSTFSDYSFNKAHATAYGVLGYQMAWLKVNHPLEFHAALLASTAGTTKERTYMQETHRCGVSMISADVNVSGATWTLDRNRKAIRRGLLSIKGVGAGAAEEIAANAPYTDLEDLINRTDSRKVNGGSQWAKTGELKGVLAKLDEAKALRSLQ